MRPAESANTIHAPCHSVLLNRREPLSAQRTDLFVKYSMNIVTANTKLCRASAQHSTASVASRHHLQQGTAVLHLNCWHHTHKQLAVMLLVLLLLLSQATHHSCRRSIIATRCAGRGPMTGHSGGHRCVSSNHLQQIHQHDDRMTPSRRRQHQQLQQTEAQRQQRQYQQQQQQCDNRCMGLYVLSVPQGTGGSMCGQGPSEHLWVVCGLLSSSGTTPWLPPSPAAA